MYAFGIIGVKAYMLAGRLNLLPVADMVEPRYPASLPNVRSLKLEFISLFDTLGEDTWSWLANVGGSKLENIDFGSLDLDGDRRLPALFQALSVQTHLHSLRLRSTFQPCADQIGSQQSSIWSALSALSVTHLDIGVSVCRPQEHIGECVTALGRMPKLQHLKLHFTSRGEHPSASAASATYSLCLKPLAAAARTQHGLPPLLSLHLLVDDSIDPREGVTYFSDLPRLYLTLQNHSSSSFEWLSHASLSGLVSLEIQQCRDPKNLFPIPFPKLETLNVSWRETVLWNGNDHVRLPLSSLLSPRPSLTQLSLQNCELELESVVACGALLKSLTVFDVTCRDWHALLSPLSSLTELVFTGNNGMALAPITELPNLRNLQIDLATNGWPDDHHDADLLPTPPNLRQLCILGFPERRLSHRWVEDFVARCPDITHLNLSAFDYIRYESFPLLCQLPELQCLFVDYSLRLLSPLAGYFDFSHREIRTRFRQYRASLEARLAFVLSG